MFFLGRRLHINRDPLDSSQISQSYNSSLNSYSQLVPCINRSFLINSQFVPSYIVLRTCHRCYIHIFFSFSFILTHIHKLSSIAISFFCFLLSVRYVSLLFSLLCHCSGIFPLYNDTSWNIPTYIICNIYIRYLMCERRRLNLLNNLLVSLHLTSYASIYII